MTIRVVLSMSLALSLAASGCSSDAAPPAESGDDERDADQGSATDDDDDDGDDEAADDDDDDADGRDASVSRPTDDGGGSRAASGADAAKPIKDGGEGGEPDGKADEPEVSDDGDDGGPDEPEPVSCAGKTGVEAGDTNATITVGGTERSYIVHVPRNYTGDKPVPLVLDFHPMLFGTAASQRRSSGYAELADEEGFIVAYADGIDNAWNLGPCCTRSREVDDFGLALAMVEKISSEACIDPKRVYAAGFSNGGGLSHYLACKSADVFAAVAPAAFDLIEEVECEPSRPISVVIFRGTSDLIVPYAGGASTPPTPYPLDPIHFLGAEGSFKEWASVNGCTGEPTEDENGCQVYEECEGEAEVTLCTARGGGHVTGDAEVAWSKLKNYTLP